MELYGLAVRIAATEDFFLNLNYVDLCLENVTGARLFYKFIRVKPRLAFLNVPKLVRK